GFGMGYLFVRRQLRVKSPMLDMALFRRGSFSGAILVNLLSVVVLRPDLQRPSTPGDHSP
uniref:hypothetical protein n=1 Tax=Microbacterium sp. BF1 TaxID=2821146 RepID=UPI001C4E2396